MFSSGPDISASKYNINMHQYAIKLEFLRPKIFSDFTKVQKYTCIYVLVTTWAEGIMGFNSLESEGAARGRELLPEATMF